MKNGAPVFAIRSISLCGILAVAVLLAPACAPALLRQPDVQNLNNQYGNQIFVATKDIEAGFSTPENPEKPEILFARGARVRLRVESQGDWLRVRAIPADQDREHNPGQVVIYVFRDFLEEDEEPDEVVDRYPPDRLQQEIDALFRPE